MSQGKGKRNELEKLLRSAWEESIRLQNRGKPYKPATPMQTPRKFRWDYTLACVAMAMTIITIVAPPQTRFATVAWLVVFLSVLVYPALHFTQWLLKSTRMWVICSTIVILALAVSLIGLKMWPPVHRHLLSSKERALFEDVLKSQKNPDPEVQVGCPADDEKTCVYAGQFITLFGEAGWTVQPWVSRLTLSKASDGVIVYRHGGNKDDMMKRWNSGGWFNLNEPHLLAAQSAFRTIHIEIDGQTDPDLAENVMMIYIGPERDDESAPTSLTAPTAWATGKIKGPFPFPKPQ